MPEFDPLQITPFPALSGLIWILFFMAAGYLARGQAHRLLLSMFRAIRHLLKVLSLYADGAARKLTDWTADIALAQARAAAARQIQWDYDRLVVRVEHELADTPELRRQLAEHLSEMESDFRRSAEPPIEPPAWGQITDTVGRLVEDRTGQVARTLEDIRDAMAQYRADAREAQRRDSYRRYLLLYRTRPRWRRVQRLLDNLDDRLARFQVRIDGLSERIAEFDALRKGDRPTVASLVAACIWRCLLSTAVLIAAGAGVVVLVSLVTEPMQAIMGQGRLAFDLPSFVVTGGLLVFFQLILGLVMMETLRATDIFPAIGALDASLRRLLFWTSFTLLLLLASAGAVLYYGLVESGLVAGQTVISLANEALVLSLVTSVTHALMVFFLPFVLVLAALPLAVFARTARVVVAAVLAISMRCLAAITRVMAYLAGITAGLAVQLYDLFIFLPLWLEGRVPRWMVAGKTQSEDNGPAAVELRGSKDAAPMSASKKQNPVAVSEGNKTKSP